MRPCATSNSLVKLPANCPTRFVRNILIHSYFGVDEDILWDVIQNKVRPLKAALQALEARDS
jgi:uncharacterized protein with HEPN domain